MPLPAGYSARPAQVEDWEQVLHLIVTRNLADYGEPLYSSQDLADLWNALELDQDTWVVVSSDGRIAAYADLQRRGPVQFDVAFYTASGHPQTEIGTHLLEQAQGRAVAVTDKRVRLIGRVGGDNESATQSFEQAGFIPGLTFLLMEIGMDSPPVAPDWPAGIHVRPFARGKDEQAAYQVDEEVSLDKGYHTPMTFEEWSRRMSLNRLAFDPSLWLLACDGDQVIGVALNILSRETGIGWVDHLGVLREWRGQGVGTALLQHTFGLFYGRGIHKVKLSVDSGSLTNAPRLYEHAGMRTTQKYHIFSKEAA